MCACLCECTTHVGSCQESQSTWNWSHKPLGAVQCSAVSAANQSRLFARAASAFKTTKPSLLSRCSWTGSTLSAYTCCVILNTKISFSTPQHPRR